MNSVMFKILAIFFKGIRNIHNELDEKDSIIEQLINENHKLDGLVRTLEHRIHYQQNKIDEWRYKYFKKEIIFNQDGENDNEDEIDSDYINNLNSNFN